MPKPKVSRDERLKSLRAALTHAVQGEQRFGARDDCREELNQRWDKVLAAMDDLWLTKP